MALHGPLPRRGALSPPLPRVDRGDVPEEGSVARSERFAVAGTPTECAAAIRRLTDAGATSVVLVPQGEQDDQIRRAAREVLPILRT